MADQCWATLLSLSAFLILIFISKFFTEKFKSYFSNFVEKRHTQCELNILDALNRFRASMIPALWNGNGGTAFMSFGWRLKISSCGISQMMEMYHCRYHLNALFCLWNVCIVNQNFWFKRRVTIPENTSDSGEYFWSEVRIVRQTAGLASRLSVARCSRESLLLPSQIPNQKQKEIYFWRKRQ